MSGKGSVEEWNRWERQRRFTLEKRTSLISDSIFLVVNDRWQRKLAVCRGHDEEDYEDQRQEVVDSIGEGVIPKLKWQNEEVVQLSLMYGK